MARGPHSAIAAFVGLGGRTVGIRASHVFDEALLSLAARRHRRRHVSDRPHTGLVFV